MLTECNHVRVCVCVDYIVGSSKMTLADKNDLFVLVEESMGQPLQLQVYNILTDAVREVTIVPDRNWGGEGSLGCDIGYGYLHRYWMILLWLLLILLAFINDDGDTLQMDEEIQCSREDCMNNNKNDSKRKNNTYNYRVRTLHSQL